MVPPLQPQIYCLSIGSLVYENRSQCSDSFYNVQNIGPKLSTQLLEMDSAGFIQCDCREVICPHRWKN